MTQTKNSRTNRDGIEWRCVKSWTREDFPSEDLAKGLPLITEVLDGCAEDYALMEEKGAADHPIKLMKYIGESGTNQDPGEAPETDG